MSSKEHFDWELFKKVFALIIRAVLLLSLASSFIVIACLIWDPSTSDNSNYIALSCLGAALFLATWGIFSLINQRREREYVFHEIRYVFEHGTTPWLLGSCTAYLIMFMYFLFPEAQFSPRQVFGFASSTLIACIGAALAIRTFSVRYSPIVDTNDLLARLIEDIRSLEPGERSRVWMVFPALNIGHWGGDENFVEYKIELERCTEKHQGMVRAVVHPRSQYEELYKSYGEMHHLDEEENADKTRICTPVADSMASDIERLGRLYECPPEQFPPHLAIIGNVTYSILTFGLPVFTKGKYIALEREKGHRAKLITYRREDRDLADELEDRLKIRFESQLVPIPTRLLDEATQESQTS